MKRPPLVIKVPELELPMEHVFRRIAALNWAYTRMHLLDEYIALGVMEALEVQRRYRECKYRFGDLAALEALEASIVALEAEV